MGPHVHLLAYVMTSLICPCAPTLQRQYGMVVKSSDSRNKLPASGIQSYCYCVNFVSYLISICPHYLICEMATRMIIVVITLEGLV